MKNIKYYKFKEHVGVVEVFCNEKFETLKYKLPEFHMMENSIPSDMQQAIYMEQYFSADRSRRICDVYDEPSDDETNFNLVFFIYFLECGQVLNTPWGHVGVDKMDELPESYKEIVIFEDAD